MKRSELKRTAFKPKAASFSSLKPEMKRSTMKTKQRAVTTQEKEFWSRLAALGCIACMKDGRFNPHVSIHHVDGRTKPGCHLMVLPLCGPHHQDDGSGAIAVHPWRARFEEKYGTQIELIAICKQLLTRS